MPARIHQDVTDNQVGLISISDVHKMLNDYRHKVLLSSSDPSRNPIHKHYYFNISRRQIEKLLDTDKDKNRNIRVHLVLNLPNQLTCSQDASIEDYLSIIVSGVNNDGTAKLAVEDPILVEGFKDFEVALDDECCVVGDPPPGS